jgi:hypothetical protein
LGLDALIVAEIFSIDGGGTVSFENQAAGIIDSVNFDIIVTNVGNTDGQRPQTRISGFEVTVNCGPESTVLTAPPAAAQM